jgi:endonuclease G
LQPASNEQAGTVLPYHNFTVVMNPERRLSRLTASNIHGRQLHSIRRADGQTRWTFDTRIPRSEQIGNDLYKHNPIDRGHMVRRLDAAWGRTRSAAMAGNDDTFHYTNSAPQHEGLNEDNESWAGLEDHYLDHARAADRKITVFTGPVFRDSDPMFESPAGERARIPRQFWKIIAYRRGGRLVADGYLLSQRDILRDNMNLEIFGGDQFETFQVPIGRIENLTALDFGTLRTGDTFDETFEEGLGVDLDLELVGGAREARRIRSLADIRLDDGAESEYRHPAGLGRD